MNTQEIRTLETLRLATNHHDLLEPSPPPIWKVETLLVSLRFDQNQNMGIGTPAPPLVSLLNNKGGCKRLW